MIGERVGLRDDQGTYRARTDAVSGGCAVADPPAVLATPPHEEARINLTAW